MPGPNPSRPRLIVLAGPTGVGKTSLSLTLAQKFGAEIINADSMQVYRHMDIGTAKPAPAELAQARHHLIDIVDPDQDFDAAEYLRLARPLITKLDRLQTPVLVVGGAGLYLRSLLRGLFQGPGHDPRIRDRLKKEAKALGREALHARLAQTDPKAAARLHPNDLVRVMRALEVMELTGRPISEFQAEHNLAENPYDVLFFCLTLPREELYARIEARTREMFEQGLVEEVEGLLARGYLPELKTMKAIGYKQVVRHVKGRLTREEAAREIMTQTRHYAKRQLTWFKSQPDVRPLSPRAADQAAEEAERFWPG